MSFYLRLHVNLKRVPLICNLLCILIPCPPCCTAEACSCLKLNYACMHSPDARPRVPQWPQFLTCFCLNYNWADLYFSAHFVASACYPLPPSLPLLDLASSRRSPLPICCASEIREASFMVLTNPFTYMAILKGTKMTLAPISFPPDGW